LRCCCRCQRLLLLSSLATLLLSSVSLSLLLTVLNRGSRLLTGFARRITPPLLRLL
jgi:hypothetical protein